jgi:hypothetical protein
LNKHNFIIATIIISNISLKTPTKKNGVQKYTFNKKRSEESSRNVCSADLEDNLGKEL